MDADVVIVGAGPTGLMLAGELLLGGAGVVVVDRLDEPHGQSRGLGFTTRAAECFDQRGLMARFGETQHSPVGHFGGLIVDFTALPGAYFGVRGILQATTERVLEDWARELGMDLRRGRTFVGLADLGDSVEVHLSGPAGEERLRCRYLVGCDGGRSTVRRAAGFDFPGTPARMEMFLADVQGAGLRPRPLGERVERGMVMAAPLGDDIDRIIVCERGTVPARDGVPPRFPEVAAAWQRLTGEDIHGYDALWVSAFTDAAHLVCAYRRNRVLLAGDAAHVHLPAGGQGLSVGVQDAVNLGWKLAATVRGDAPDDLLDTYHAERHPVGARLLMNTQAQGLLYLSGPEVDPLRTVMTELIAIPEVSRHLAGMVSGLDIRYPTGAGDHPLLGRRVPPHTLVTDAGKTSTVEILRGGRGVLLDLADDPGLRESAAGWAHRVDVVTARPLDGGSDPPIGSLDSLLVRPDGYVAWLGPGSAVPLTDALSRWFGAPVPVSTTHRS